MLDKIFKYFATGIFLLAIAWFFYGVVRFPDNPIRVCGEEKFCGKGTIRSKNDYEAFLFWNRSSNIIFLLGVLLAGLSQTNPNLLSGFVNKLRKKKG